MTINAMSQITIDVQPYNGFVYVGFFALGLSDRQLVSFDMNVELANLFLSQMEIGKTFFMKDESEEFGTIYFTPVDSKILVTWDLKNGRNKTKTLILAHLDEDGSKQFIEQVKRSIRKVVQ